jgi:SAM-dependent methyltransferase
MFVEEAAWLARTLAALPLPESATALDVGSSTQDYRTSDQPYIERDVVAPLVARGATWKTLDAKDAPGVDFVLDLTADAAAVEAAVGATFALVLCANVLVHVADPPAAAASLRRLVAPAGHLVVTTPSSYRRTTDPVDNGWRPLPAELAALLLGGDERFEVVTATSLRIDDRRYYRRVTGRPSWQRIGRRWVPLPGAVEAVRRAVPALRWRESCVVLRRR